ncbi:uncharacterized protein LOC136076881 [Hydra vulgaris]|uniref:Uncharacterized protein LOC136076881 n=1 Tax=Hydra vulgaris TaxID=6087 RepID=A0ABM4BCJ7_HYDVU
MVRQDIEKIVLATRHKCTEVQKFSTKQRVWYQYDLVSIKLVADKKETCKQFLSVFTCSSASETDNRKEEAFKLSAKLFGLDTKDQVKMILERLFTIGLLFQFNLVRAKKKDRAGNK